MKLLALGALAVLGSGYAVTQRMGNTDKPVEFRVEAAAEGIVTILIPSGEITIEGWSNDEIEVVGTLDSEDADIMLISDHGHAELSLIGDAPTDRATLHVRMPFRSNVDFETTSANLTVSGLEGILRFGSVDGHLIVDGELRGVVARSVTGNIEIPAANIPGFAHSEQGAVRLGSGTGRSLIGRARLPRRGAPTRGLRADSYAHLGEHVSGIILEALESVDVDGLIEYDRAMSQLAFDLSGSMNIDLADLEGLFDEVAVLLADIEYQIGDELTLLSEELEQIGDELRRETRDERRRR